MECKRCSMDKIYSGGGELFICDKRREMTSNFGSNSSNLDQKSLENDSLEAREVVKEATGGFGGKRESVGDFGAVE